MVDDAGSSTSTSVNPSISGVDSSASDAGVKNTKVTSLVEEQGILTDAGEVTGVTTALITESTGVVNEVGSTQSAIASVITSPTERIGEVESVTGSSISTVDSPITSIAQEEVTKNVVLVETPTSDSGTADEAGSITATSSNSVLVTEAVTTLNASNAQLSSHTIGEEDGIAEESGVTPASPVGESAQEVEAMGDDSKVANANIQNVSLDEAIAQIENIVASSWSEIPSKGHAYAEEETDTEGPSIGLVESLDTGIVEWDGSWTPWSTSPLIEDLGVADDESHIADTRIQDAEIEGEGVGEETNTTGVTRQGVNTTTTPTAVPSLIKYLTIPLYQNKESHARPLIEARLVTDGITEVDTKGSGITDVRVISVVQSLIREVTTTQASTSQGLTSTSGISDIVSVTTFEESTLESSPKTSATDKNESTNALVESIVESTVQSKSQGVVIIGDGEGLEGQRYYTGDRIQSTASPIEGTRL